MLGTLLTVWTIRLALAAYALWLAAWLAGPAAAISLGPRTSRWLYTVGCGLFLAHVACAFHFYHHWSHREAFHDTAQQTKEMLGIAFGEGIYFSYFFTLLWVADVAWLWLAPQRRWPWLTAATQLYLAFIALNGAVVFEAGVTRWVGIPVALLLGITALRRLFTPHSGAPPGSRTSHSS
ncbi:MAG TPA: hypothetical protein VFB96_13535 [Pirellulaceae bacterium]|nr:hypothetical protein [Pirellulaceae bacterium]